MCGNKIKLKEADYNKIKEICDKFGNNPGELINVLHQTQGHFGYLPIEVQEAVAANLGIPVNRVYGVVSFYSFFTMKPKGKYAISLCLGTACYVKGAEKILDALKNELKIEVGEVTADGKFSIDVLRCVGACGLAPVMTIGDKTYGHMTPEKVKQVLAEY